MQVVREGTVIGREAFVTEPNWTDGRTVEYEVFLRG